MFAVRAEPTGVAVAPNGLAYVADRSGTIWLLESDRSARPETRPPRAVPVDTGPSRLVAPAGISVGPDGSLYVAEPSRHRISVIDTGRSVRVLAGGVNGFRDGPAGQAMFRHPTDVAVGPDGTCYVADTGNHRIRVISPDGMVTTLAGSVYDYGDGQGPHGRFRLPAALDMDGDGVCYVADSGNNAIRRVTPDGQVTTLAGRPTGGDRDGRGDEARFRWPAGIAVTATGSLWVSDFGNGALRRISPAGETVTAFNAPGACRPVAVDGFPGGEAALVALSCGRAGEPLGYLLVHGYGHQASLSTGPARPPDGASAGARNLPALEGIPS